ncbi:hypothetical protein B0H11DRAFT_2213578 [Mycena galericulata]|nr:hypothetical protein B0H11DRAFT_2213578 [Mycena galericulata]
MFARLCAVTSARLCAAPPCARPVLRLSSRVGWVSLCTATSSLIPRGVGAVALCASVRCYVCASVRCYVCASVRCASVRPSCASTLIPRGVGVVVHRDFVAHPAWGGRGCPLRVCALLCLRVCALLRLRVCALRVRAPVLCFDSHPAWGGCRCAPRLRRSSHMGWARVAFCASVRCASVRLSCTSALIPVGWVSLCTATLSLIPHGVGAAALCASVRCYVCMSVRSYVCASVCCASVRLSRTSAFIPRGVGVVVQRDFVAHPAWGGHDCPLRVCALLRLRVRAPVL